MRQMVWQKAKIFDYLMYLMFQMEVEGQMEWRLKIKNVKYV